MNFEEQGQKLEGSKPEQKPQRLSFTGLGLSIGASLGFILALLLLNGNAALGIGIGAGVGLVIGSILDNYPKKN